MVEQSNQNSSIILNVEHKENPETTENNLHFDSLLLPPWWPQHAKPKINSNPGAWFKSITISTKQG